MGNVVFHSKLALLLGNSYYWLSTGPRRVVTGPDVWREERYDIWTLEEEKGICVDVREDEEDEEKM